jgi:hypothetical protein
MARASDYSQVVAQAEAAVAAVKDPELKRIAFQKVLDDLLSLPGKPSSAARSPKVARPARDDKSKKRAKTGPQAYIGEMIDDGFFKKPKTIAQVKAELENRGHHIALTSLSGPLQKLCQRRILRRQKVKSGKKQTFAYSHW